MALIYAPCAYLPSPSITVEEELKTINPARKGLGIFWVVARFVGAEDLHNVAVSVSVARYFFFE